MQQKLDDGERILSHRQRRYSRSDLRNGGEGAIVVGVGKLQVMAEFTKLERCWIHLDTHLDPRNHIHEGITRDKSMSEHAITHFDTVGFCGCC